jgi:hypothetical protein
MVVITLISQREQALVKPALICPAFISPDQQDRLSLRIKSKSHPSYLTVPGKTNLFHVGVSGTLEGINRGASQIGLKLIRQNHEFSVESIMKENGPSHG